MKYGKLTSRPARRSTGGPHQDRMCLPRERLSMTSRANSAMRSSGTSSAPSAPMIDRGRVDAAHQIRPAGRGVVVGGVVQRLDGHPQCRIGVDDLRIQLLHRRLGEDRARTHRLIALFLEVPATRGVERHDAARPPPGSGRRGRKPASSGSAMKPCSAAPRLPRTMVANRFTLPAERQRHALDLLVVLEFDGVQAGELDGDRRGARDARRGVVVGDVHLLHVATGDHVALGGRGGRRPSPRRRDTSARRSWCRAAARHPAPTPSR